MPTFCIACAAANPRATDRCRACGVPIGRARAIESRTGRGVWQDRLHLVLAIVLPLTLLLAAGGYWRADQTAKAAAYERGLQAVALGDPERAIVAFADAGRYRDAAERHTAMQQDVAPFRALYQAGVAAAAAGDHDGAIAALLPVVRAYPSFRDASSLLAHSRTQRQATVERERAAAMDRGDWLTTERALATLVALDPGNDRFIEELAAFRRERSPVVYTRDNTLYVASPDGSSERTLPIETAAAWPVWSPNREQIAFLSPDGNQLALYVVNRDGSGLTRLGERVRPYDAPVWSPDGARIAFLSTAALDGLDLTIDPAVAAISASAPGASRAVPLREPALRVVEVATGRIIDPTGGGVTSVMSPSWSPAGDRIILISRVADELDQRLDDFPGGELLVVDVATGSIARPDDGQIFFPWHVAWSPKREMALVWTRAPGQAYDAEESPLYLLDLTTKTVTDINPERARVTMPVWSPNGNSFAFLEESDRLRVRSLTGDDRAISLEESGSEFLSWSPDGATLIVAGGGRPSQIVALSGDAIGQSISVSLTYDTSRRQGGPPQWGPLHPVSDPRPPTVSGTAWDA